MQQVTGVREISVTSLPTKTTRTPTRADKKKKKRERKQIAVEKGNEYVLDNCFVVVFVYPPGPRVAVGGGAHACRQVCLRSFDDE